MRRRKRDRFAVFNDGEEVNPLTGLVNLFDVAMVFAVSLMVAFALSSRLPDFLTSSDVTVIKNAGTPEMEIIVKKDNKITRYTAEENSGTGKGRRVGVAYQLENGEIVYVPED